MTVTASQIKAPSAPDVPKTHSIERAVNALRNVLVVDEEWAWDGLCLVFNVRLPLALAYFFLVRSEKPAFLRWLSVTANFVIVRFQ